MIRKQFLLSTATICLMLASGLVYAQSPADSKKDDTQKERVQKNEPAKGAESRSDVKGQEKSSEHTGAKDQKTPAASMEKDGAAKHDQKDRAGNEGAKPNDQAGDSRHGSKDAASEKSAQEKSAQEKSAQEKSAREKSAQDSQKSKTGESKSGAASTERPQNQNQAGETSKTGPAPSQQSSTPPNAQSNKPAAANESDRNRTTSETQRGQPGSSATVSTSQTQISSDKQVRISETLSRQQLPPPERNLNVSISVGTELPTTVRLHRLPPDIISVVPEYRDYEYVTTEEEIVIVDPHSHRIVSTLPKDPSRARAQLQGGSNTADMRGGAASTNVAGNTANPCRIMRRDASGQLSEVSPTTIGSTAQRPNSLAVIVQTPDKGSTPPIQLDAQAGQINVATQGQGDCTVTIEPQGAK